MSSLAISYGGDPGATIALGILNPLVLLFLIGSGHNDALMVGLLLDGLALARRDHPLVGIVLCAMGGAVKAPGLVGVLAIGWTACGSEASTWRRAFSFARAGVITVATFEFLALLFSVGWGWVHTFGASADITNWITPLIVVARVLPHILSFAHVGISTTSLLEPLRLLGLAAALLVALWTLWRLPKLGLPN